MRFNSRIAAFGPLTIAMVGLVTAWPVSAAAFSAAAGTTISGPCSACHGSNGINADTSTPNPVGQHSVYLLNRLEAYKNGTRKSPIVREMVASLTRQQMEDLAVYYASIPIRVGSATGGK